MNTAAFNNLTDLCKFPGLNEGDRFEVWYATDFGFRMASHFGSKDIATLDLSKTHVFMGSVGMSLRSTENCPVFRMLDGLYYDLQGENWSPNGEANQFVRSRCADHTSMSVGDIIIDKTTNIAYLCKGIGWHKIQM